MGSRNGTVNSLLSSVPDNYEPRLRYDHMATLSHLPNGSIAAQWQVQLSPPNYHLGNFTGICPNGSTVALWQVMSLSRCMLHRCMLVTTQHLCAMCAALPFWAVLCQKNVGSSEHPRIAEHLRHATPLCRPTQSGLRGLQIRASIGPSQMTTAPHGAPPAC